MIYLFNYEYRVGDFKLIVGNEGFVDGYSPNLQYFWDYYAYMVSY